MFGQYSEGEVSFRIYWKVLVGLLVVVPHEAAKGVLSVAALEVLRIVLPVLVRFHIYGT